MTVESKKEGEEKKKGEEIKYVAIEMLMKDADLTKKIATDQKDSIEAGVLQGIQTKREPGEDEDDTFILLSCADGVIKACNMSVYNVLTHEVYNGTERVIIFFRASEEDQIAAMNIIEDTVEALREAKRMTANDGIIDISTFSDLPKDFSDKSNIRASSTTPLTTPHKASNTTNIYKGGASSYHDNTYIAKEKEALSFKRSSKKPNKALLEAMEESVNSITAGHYKAPDLPIIEKDDDPDDDKEDDSTSSTTTSTSAAGLAAKAQSERDFQIASRMPYSGI